MATHSSILAWRIPETGGAWWATAHKVAESQTGINDPTMDELTIIKERSPGPEQNNWLPSYDTTAALRPRPSALGSLSQPPLALGSWRLLLRGSSLFQTGLGCTCTGSPESCYFVHLGSQSLWCRPLNTRRQLPLEEWQEGRQGDRAARSPVPPS